MVALDVKQPPIRAHQPLGGNRNPPSGGAEESQNSSAPGDGEDGEIYSLALDGDGVMAWAPPKNGDGAQKKIDVLGLL